MLGKLPVPAQLTLLAHGPKVLAVGAGGVVWTLFLSSYISSFPLSLEDGPK